MAGMEYFAFVWWAALVVVSGGSGLVVSVFAGRILKFGVVWLVRRSL